MADRFSAEMQSGTRAAWSRFVEIVEPFRSDLARYCGRQDRPPAQLHLQDAIREVAETLGLPVGPVFYSFRPFLAAWQSMPAAALN